MNAKCEFERSPALQSPQSPRSAADMTARLAHRTVRLRDLMRSLHRASAATLSSEFACSPAALERHVERSRFSPSLSFGRHFCPPLPTAKPAAVMMLIEPRQGQWVLPLTVRPNHLPDHPGQVCLPGGRLEAGETVTQAAEREFCEELGVQQFPGRTLGQLQSIYVYNTDYYMTPCVAVCDRAPVYHPNPDEVESLVYLPLADLLNADLHVVKSHSRGAANWTARGIEARGIHIWGATAIVLGELAAVLRSLER